MPRWLILLDTNLLMLAMAGRLNLSAQLAEVCPEGVPHVPRCVMEELTRMEEPLAAAARELALNFPLLETQEGPVDDLLLEYAAKEGYLVATNDGGLITRIKALKRPVLRLRGRHRLVLEGTFSAGF